MSQNKSSTLNELFKNKEAWLLLTVSFLGLFCELMIIRWLATEIRIFAYFKNLPLMSAFLGLGLGFMLTNYKTNFFKYSSSALLYLSCILASALALGFTHLTFGNYQKENLMMFGAFIPFSNLTAIKTILCMLAIFALTVFFFIGLGQETGKYFQKFSPLKAYSINVFGGLLGILSFSLLSYCETGPGIWLILIGCIFLFLDRRLISILLIVFGITYASLIEPVTAKAVFGQNYVKTIWSPYYRIDVIKTIIDSGPHKGKSLGFDIYVNYDSYQSILDLRPENFALFHKALQNELDEYHAKPIIAYGKQPERVLILGAGSGSDVASALRHGAKFIDAVEIDPGIYRVGRQLHPEKPYDSDKVKAHIMDARTFLKNSPHKYNVIVFAGLDSHTAFSSLSSLRTDNYIFTEESLKEAAKLLTDDGILCITFVAIPDWLWDRHTKSIAKIFPDNVPIGFYKGDKLPTGFVICGPGINGKAAKDIANSWQTRVINVNPKIESVIDDWPFLFLPQKEIPNTYIWPILIILIATTIPLIGKLKNNAQPVLNWLMFGLGAGFMLLEVRSMASLSLIFGSTWIINSVVISAVLIFVLCANWLVSKLNLSHVRYLAALAILSLLFSISVDANMLSAFGPLLGGISGCVAFLLPLVFASSIFSLFFKYAQDANTTLAYNLLGGLIGICLEYLSMYLGIRALGYIALAIYFVLLTIYFSNRNKVFPHN